MVETADLEMAGGTPHSRILQTSTPQVDPKHPQPFANQSWHSSWAPSSRSASEKLQRIIDGCEVATLDSGRLGCNVWQDVCHTAPLLHL